GVPPTWISLADSGAPGMPRIAAPGAPSSRRWERLITILLWRARYFPGGKWTVPPAAGSEAIARRMAGVSSATPSPTAPAVLTSTQAAVGAAAGDEAGPEAAGGDADAGGAAGGGEADGGGASPAGGGSAGLSPWYRLVPHAAGAIPATAMRRR